MHGHLLFHREGSLLARPFDLKTLRFTEEAFPVAEDVQFFAVTAHAVFSASDQGFLAYQAGSGGSRTQLTWLDRAGKLLGAVGAPGSLSAPHLSHDGRRVAISVMDSQGTGDVWIYDLERNIPTRLTFEPTNDIAPVWSRDNSRIVFSTSRKSPGDLYVKDSAGTANEMPLVVSGAFKVPSDWSPDGRVLLFQVIDARTRGGWDLWTYSTADRKATPFLQTAFNEIQAKFSPDGHWIAYVSNESGKEEVYVMPFPEHGGKWQVSTAGGRAPIWTRGGREIVYQSPGDELMSVDVRTNPSFQAGIPKTLFKTNLQPPPGRQWDATPDGERFLVNLRPGEQTSSPITLVQNWAAGRKP